MSLTQYFESQEDQDMTRCEQPRPQPANFFLKLGLIRTNGWDCDAQNVEFCKMYSPLD